MSNLFDKLSKEDVRKIDAYMNSTVGGHSNLEYLLREWDRQKVNLYHMFGDQFILNKKIEYNKPINNLVEELNEKFGDYNNICNKFRRTFDRFLWENRMTLGDDYDLLQSLMDTKKLINTVYDGDTFYVNAPDGKPVKVQNGCKPMRLISKVCRLYNVDLEGLEQFQNEVSVVLNQKKLTGDLTLSIHPLDYMTMSDNESGWSSCMSWREEGCYCRGTVEMMNSPMVVVAYLNAEKPMRISGDMTWSNKKWRELFVVNPQIITGVKGYPYQNEDLVQIVNSWLRDLAVANLGWNFDKNNVAYKPDKYFTYKNDLGQDRDVYLGFSTNTMYNDFGTIEHHYAIFGSDLNNYNLHINYSGLEECMNCGSLDGYFDGEGALVCEDCDRHLYCDSCGERLYDDGDVYYLDDVPYCRYCYEDRAVTCPIDGEDHDRDNMKIVYLISEDVEASKIREYVYNNTVPRIEVYHNNINGYYWNNYFNQYAETFNETSWGRTGYYVRPSMLRSDGFDLFEVSPSDYDM